MSYKIVTINEIYTEETERRISELLSEGYGMLTVLPSKQENNLHLFAIFCQMDAANLADQGPITAAGAPIEDGAFTSKYQGDEETPAHLNNAGA